MRATVYRECSAQHLLEAVTAADAEGGVGVMEGITGAVLIVHNLALLRTCVVLHHRLACLCHIATTSVVTEGHHGHNMRHDVHTAEVLRVHLSGKGRSTFVHVRHRLEAQGRERNNAERRHALVQHDL